MGTNKNLVLIGMMGCGKSTIARLLGRRLDRNVVDTDDLIEEREGLTIPEIFAREGEQYFRDLELTVAKELSQMENLVIACGGGLPMRPECMTALKEKGVVFWINRDPGTIFDQVSMVDRPLGQGSREDFLAKFAQREPVYRRWADHIIEGHALASEAEGMIGAIWEAEA